LVFCERAMNPPDKRTIAIKAQSKGMFLTPWVNNDPTLPEKAIYWLVDEETDLPCNVDPASLAEIEELLSELPDKHPDARPDPTYGDGTEA
jgi:hypothetical protein